MAVCNSQEDSVSDAEDLPVSSTKSLWGREPREKLDVEKPLQAKDAARCVGGDLQEAQQGSYPLLKHSKEKNKPRSVSPYGRISGKLSLPFQRTEEHLSL